MNNINNIENQQQNGLDPGDFLPKSLKNWNKKKYFHWLEFRCQQKIRLAISNAQITLSDKNNLGDEFEKNFNLFIKSLFDVYMYIFNFGYVWLGTNELGHFIYSEKETVDCKILLEDDYYSRNKITRKQVVKVLYDDFDNVCSADSDLIENRGVLGILQPVESKKDTPFTPREQTRFNQLINSTFGLLKRKFKIWVADVPVKYDKIELPIEQLKLPDRKIQLKIDIGEMYGIPVELMPKDYSAKFDNLDISIQMFYQDEITPFIYSIIEKLLMLPRYVFIDIVTIMIDFPNVNAIQKTKQLEYETKKIQIYTEIEMMNAGVQTLEETKIKIKEIQVK